MIGSQQVLIKNLNVIGVFDSWKNDSFFFFITLMVYYVFRKVINYVPRKQTTNCLARRLNEKLLFLKWSPVVMNRMTPFWMAHKKCEINQSIHSFTNYTEIMKHWQMPGRFHFNSRISWKSQGKLDKFQSTVGFWVRKWTQIKF